jgi:predicted RNA-binding Zn-ribbon protein involved in translation (DUF1610 family)
MMGDCRDCAAWVTARVTDYGDGTRIVNFESSSGKGECHVLKIETAEDFGCNKFRPGNYRVVVTRKDGYPHQYFTMIPCPDCGGKGDGGRGHRCAGTGLVRLYDDGYVGDEQTRMHPKEKETALPTTCQKCGAAVEPSWAHCPSCGGKLWKVAETEIVDDLAAGLPVPEAS